MSAFTQAVRSWTDREGTGAPRAVSFALGIAFVLLTAAGAWVEIRLPPALTPVPITLQPLFVLLAGAIMGPRAGAVAMVAYVLLGAAGAPVFAGGRGGFPWLLGPTGGYLLAYPVAAFVVGHVAGRSAGGLRMLVALTLGMAAIYVGGASQLWMLTRQDFSTLMIQSVLPFLVGDALKVVVAWFTMSSLRLVRPAP